MTKKKKKESWKEKRREAAIKHQKALEAERLRREREPKKSKGLPKGKIFGVTFMFLLIIGVYGAWQYTQSSPSDNSNVNGQKAPLFALEDFDGKAVVLENLTGKVVILDFFATWCNPCITQIPYLAEINRDYDSSNVEIISIGSSGDSEDGLQQFKDTNGMDWTVARDTDGVFDKYSVSYIPTIVIIDQDGYIYYKHEGVTDVSTLSTKINALLGD
jgi:peroxiredoxin